MSYYWCVHPTIKHLAPRIHVSVQMCNVYGLELASNTFVQLNWFHRVVVLLADFVGSSFKSNTTSSHPNLPRQPWGDCAPLLLQTQEITFLLPS